MKNTLIISTISSIIVFLVVYIKDYRSISYHQTHQPITSFPPSSAWLTALPYAVGTFVSVAIIAWIFLRK